MIRFVYFVYIFLSLDMIQEIDVSECALEELPELWVVVPCYNEEACLPELVHQIESLQRVLSPKVAFRFLLVDDGSTDRTRELARKVAARHDWFCVHSLRKNRGHQAALWKGYCLVGESIGDCGAVVSMDADLQDPPSLIPELCMLWFSGAEVVLPVRRRRTGDAAAKKIAAFVFYRALSMVSPHTQADCGDFRLLGACALRALLERPQAADYMRGETLFLPGPVVALPFDRGRRFAGVEKYGWVDSMRLAFEGFRNALRRSVAQRKARTQQSITKQVE